MSPDTHKLTRDYDNVHLEAREMYVVLYSTTSLQTIIEIIILLSTVYTEM